MNDYPNLIPFDQMDPEQHRELSRRGGLASGQRRRDLAEARDLCMDFLIASDLQRETRKSYRAAIQRIAKQEQSKRKRRKPRESPIGGFDG